MSNTTADPGSDPRPQESAAEVPHCAFGWWDMFVHPDDDPRADGGFENNERAMLIGFLRDRRLTLELKCADLDAAGMARRSVEPSDLSLLGLVRHMADVERSWFRRVMAGQDTPSLYGSDTDSKGEFSGAVADPEVVAEAWANWRAEVAFAERFVAESPDLGVLAKDEGNPTVPLRQVLVHMIEEYARHNGHADLLRERIDGRVGQ